MTTFRWHKRVGYHCLKHASAYRKNMSFFSSARVPLLILGEGLVHLMQNVENFGLCNFPSLCLEENSVSTNENKRPYLNVFFLNKEKNVSLLRRYYLFIFF